MTIGERTGWLVIEIAVVAVLVPILAVLLPPAVMFWAFGGFR